MSIAVLFIAVGIWNMDPGKDSIIYRMTTTRMKKEWDEYSLFFFSCLEIISKTNPVLILSLLITLALTFWFWSLMYCIDSSQPVGHSLRYSCVSCFIFIWKYCLLRPADLFKIDSTLWRFSKKNCTVSSDSYYLRFFEIAPWNIVLLYTMFASWVVVKLLIWNLFFYVWNWLTWGGWSVL